MDRNVIGDQQRLDWKFCPGSACRNPKPPSGTQDETDTCCCGAKAVLAKLQRQKILQTATSSTRKRSSNGNLAMSICLVAPMRIHPRPFTSQFEGLWGLCLCLLLGPFSSIPRLRAWRPALKNRLEKSDLCSRSGRVCSIKR